MVLLVKAFCHRISGPKNIQRSKKTCTREILSQSAQTVTCAIKVPRSRQFWVLLSDLWWGCPLFFFFLFRWLMEYSSDVDQCVEMIRYVLRTALKKANNSFRELRVYKFYSSWAPFFDFVLKGNHMVAYSGKKKIRQNWSGRSEKFFSMSDSKISNSEAIICLWTNSLNRCCLRL